MAIKNEISHLVTIPEPGRQSGMALPTEMLSLKRHNSSDNVDLLDDNQ